MPSPAGQPEVVPGIDTGGRDAARADASPDVGDGADPDAASPAIELDAVAHPDLDNVVTVALRHSAEGLRKTYLDRQGRRKDGMQLPRIIVFNGEGRLLGGQGGFSTGDMRHLRRLVHDDKPFPRAADLEDTLAELETADGTAVPRAALPAADVFLVVYRSADCPRCDRLDAELAVVVRGLHRHRFAWLMVESDPGRVDAQPRPASR